MTFTSFTAFAAAAEPLSLLFVSGTPAPGSSELFGTSPSGAAVGPDGVAFFAPLGTSNGAFYGNAGLEPHAGVVTLVRRNDPIPPTGAAWYLADTAVMSSGGRALVSGLVTTTPSAALFSLGGPSGPFSLTVRAGDPSPIAGWAIAPRSGSSRLANVLYGAGTADAMWAGAITNGTTSVNGLLAFEGGQVRALAFPGDPATGMGTGATFRGDALGVSYLTPIAVTAAGEKMFWGEATGLGLSSGADDAIWLGRSGSVRIAMREGDPAPGYPAGTTILLPWAFGGASGETLIVMGRVQGPTITTSNDRCMWIGTPGDWRVLIRETDALPGLPAGAVVDDHYLADYRNGASLVRATLRGTGVTGSNNTALVRCRDGAIETMIREGDPLPGGDGAVFVTNNEGSLALDADGRLLFTVANAAGNQFARLWVLDAPGIGRPLLSEGQVVPIGPGDARTVSEVRLVNRLGGQFASTDDGRVLLSITFSNRTYALATLDLTPCPCPADFDGSGGTPDLTDISAYFGAWLAGDPSADADCSGGTPDLTDISAFFAAWLAGGC